MHEQSKQEFMDWVNHPVTIAIKEEFRQRVELFSERLITQAGHNPVDDAKISGLVQGYRDFLEAKLEDVQEAE